MRRSRRLHPTAVHGRMEEVVEHGAVDVGPGDVEHRGREHEAGIPGVLLTAMNRQPCAHIPKHAQWIATVDRTARNECVGPRLTAA